MKPEVIIQQGLKSANILLKNAQKRAAELDYMKGELMDIVISGALTTQMQTARPSKVFSGM